MILTSNYPNIPLYVGNATTDLVRRDNSRREVIEPVREMERSAKDKGLQADDKGRDSRQSAVTYGDESKTKGLVYEQAITRQDEENDSEGQQGSSRQQSEAEQKQQQAEQQEISELKARDAEVRAHEQAHASIGGQYAGSPSYDFDTGPDGQKYAVGGEVPIDVSEVANDPQATIQKMQQVKAAALAPAEPSGADRTIAAEAGRKILEARADLVSEHQGQLAQAGQDQSEVSTTTANADAIVVDTSAVQPKVSKSLQDPLMRLRSEVISGFYARATVPTERPLLQTA